jgi:hypothetical protein
MLIGKYILFLEPLHSSSGLLFQPSVERRVMQQGQHFRLTRSAMAIAQRDARNLAIMIPEGAVIEVIGGPFNGTRLMDVRYVDELVMMFTNDMENHTERLEGKGDPIKVALNQ